MTTFGCVVLTMCNRPEDLGRGVASLLAQRDVDVDVVVVGNGCTPAGVPDGVPTVALPENIGATAGRNAGVEHVSGELLLFLDDDAKFPDDDSLAHLARVFSDPSIAVVQPRVVDPHGEPAARRHVPRLVVGDVRRSSDVTTFWEGAVVIRRSAFTEVGGFSDTFWYAHEGADLAWRLMDAGYRVRYEGGVVANHPAPATPPHSYYHYLASRNRVWLARRYLPWPLAILHVGVWFAISTLRLRKMATAAGTFRGYRDGVRLPAGPRKPLRWRTIWRMTRMGRPPII